MTETDSPGLTQAEAAKLLVDAGLFQVDVTGEPRRTRYNRSWWWHKDEATGEIKRNTMQYALLCYIGREAMIGGAKGGGKSVAIVQKALQYSDFPEFRALVLRRTWPELSKGGGLIDKLAQELAGTGAEWNEQKRLWKIPCAGRQFSQIQLGHCEHKNDRFNYQGDEYHLVCVDQAEEFEPEVLMFLRAQQRRRTGSRIPLQFIVSANPGGLSHSFLKSRYLEKWDKNCVFLPSRLDDNPFVDRESAEESLKGLSKVEYQQWRYGDWEIQPSGGFFRREWFPIVDSTAHYNFAVRGWDTAATLPGPGTDPDYTVGTLTCIDQNTKKDRILHRIKGRWAGHTVERIMEQTMQSDGPQVMTVIEQQPGSAGENEANRLKQRFAKYWVKFVPATGRNRKIEMAKPCQSAAEGGMVELQSGDWNVEWLDCVTAFGQKGIKDDDVDSWSLARSELHRQDIKRVWGEEMEMEPVYDGFLIHR